MKAQILCRVRPGSTKAFSVAGEETVIGRDSAMGVSLTLEGVSRRHARVVWDGKSHWVEDLGSTNGTFLNGHPVQREKLRHLDVITLGKKVELLFLIRSEEAQVVTRRGIVGAFLVPEAPDALPYEIPVGEATIGRSAACNITAENGAVSKLHARVIRTADGLALEDLGSSNGTFVNGVRVMSAFLDDGDVVTLASVENFRVVVEMGEITTGSGVRFAPMGAPGAALADSGAARPRFSPEWKTRFDWDSQELRILADVQRQVMAEKSAPLPAAGRSGATTPPAGRSPAPQSRFRTTPPPLPRPAVAGKPSVAPPPASKQEAATMLPQPASLPPRPAPPPPPAAAPSPPTPAAADPPTLYKSGPVAPAMPTPAAGPGQITEVRLAGVDFSFIVKDAGAHDLGRAKEAALRVTHPTVSRQHARLILSNDRAMAYVEDRGGANGTLVNGIAIKGVHPLVEGDVIQVGDVQLAVSLRRG